MLTLEINQLFDQRYLITDRLGEGGMGLVFAAKDTQRGDLPCAIKVLQYRHQEKQHSIRRLTQERSVMAKLRHENIVDVFDVVSSSQSKEHYLVMPLLRGDTFNQWIDDQRSSGNPVTLEFFLQLICQVLNALHHAHRMGVIHRDLKPDNLFICEDQGHPYVKVLDFGIAKDLQDDGQITAESENAMIGTPRYMAPEQITNKEISAQTDLYALAILTYERIVGVHPFETEECKQSNPMRGMPTSVQMSWNHLNAIPQKLKGLGMLGELLMHALEKEPRARPKSAHLVCDKIKKWLSLNQSLAQERLPLGRSLFNDATPIPSSDSIDRLPRVTPTPSLNQSGARPKRSDSLSTGERSKRSDSLDTGERSTPTADSTRERTRTARRSKKSVAAPAAKPAQTSPLLRYIKWAARVILAIYLSAWLWYLSGSPQIPLLHDLIAPLFNAICHWGISVNDQLTR